MGRTLMVVAVASLALFAVSTASAKEGGNSANAKLCQKDGWKNLVRADGTTFADQAECVSYGALGGTPVSPAQDRTGEEACADIGGHFIGPVPQGIIAWYCDAWPIAWPGTDYAAQTTALDDACRVDLGSNYAETFTQFNLDNANMLAFGSTACYRRVAG